MGGRGICGDRLVIESHMSIDQLRFSVFAYYVLPEEMMIDGKNTFVS